MTWKLLNEEEISYKRSLISTPFPLINSVVLGQQEGKIFATDDNFFIIHKSGFSYFKPSDGFCDYDALLGFFIQSKEISGYFHVYDAPQKLLDVFRKDNDSVTIKIRNRIQLKLNGPQVVTQSEVIPPGFNLKRITEENLSSLSVFNLDLGNKFWRSEEDFLQNGFGFCVFTSSGEPASICYSACIAAAVAEIDVSTLQPFRQKDLAKKSVYGFVNFCIDKGITANWDCFEDNTGSLNTALSVGFERTFDYTLLSIFNKQKER